MALFFPNLCLWRRSLRSNVGGIDPEKLYRATLSDFGVKQILYRVDIALYVHPKNSLRSHLRAIMVLDHSR